MRADLTDKLARTIEPLPGKNLRVFDQSKASPRGLLLRVTSAGARVWALRYRVANSGREREITIGDVASWPLAEARKRGHELRRMIDAGGDPLGDRQEKRAEPTVAELIARYVAQRHPRLAPATQEENLSMLRRYIEPAIGKRRLGDVSREHIMALHRKITEAGYPRRANAVVTFCSVIFNTGIEWGLLSANPAKGVQRNREHARERYLTPEETERLVVELDRRRERRPDSVDTIRLALMTGARRGELLTMRWADLDLDARVWVKPHPTTKQRKLHRVPLAADAVAVLQRRLDERTAGGKVVRLRDDFVFRGGGSKSHVRALERDWELVRAACGLDDVHFHDLRHNHASLLVAAGLSLPIIGALLGHSRPATTQRYAHLGDQPLREAAELVAAKLRTPIKAGAAG